MRVALYPLGSGWTFRRQRCQPVRVTAPDGSKLLESRLFGLELFVPSTQDPLQLLPWSASQVATAVRAGDPRFQIEIRATGPLATRCAG